MLKYYYYLNEIVTPKRYQMRLRFDFDQKKLFGHLNIQIRINNKTNIIEMNSFGLKILKATFSTGSIRIDANRIYYCPANEIVVLHFPKHLHRGSANITINYLANITDLIRKQILHTSYAEYQQISWIDFGTIDARQLFPCWDEPHYKAQYDLYLIIPKNQMAISNMQIDRRKSYSHYLDEIHFNQTPMISTFQMTIMMAKRFEIISSEKNRTKVRIQLITMNSNDSNQWQFAIESTEYILEYFQYYYGHLYPLEKLDLVILESNYRLKTSMEKLGLMYFTRQDLSISNVTIASERDLQTVVSLLAHSLSHQWLGNMVTFDDWSEFWLFESLNQFMEKQAMDDVFPHWRSWQQYTADEMSLALRLDSSRINIKSIKESIRHPINVSMMYPQDVNIYRKSTFLLRMLKQNLDRDIFRLALQKFINKYWTKTGNLKNLQECFITVIDEIDGKDKQKYHRFRQFQKQIVQIFSNWTEMAGFPVLHVDEQQQGNSRILRIHQERFFELRNSTINISNKKSTLWPIPISIVKSFNPFMPSNHAIINDEKVELRIQAIWPGEWIKLNPSFSNFYRVHYSDEMLNRFIVSIEEKLLPPLDRLNLVDDTFAMIRAGYTSTVTGLKLLQSFENEDNPNIWSIIITMLTDLHLIISNIESDHDRQSIQSNFELYAQRLLKRMYQQINWYSSANYRPIGYRMKIQQFAQNQLRAKLLCAMGQFHYENFFHEAHNQFQNYMNNNESNLPIELLECVFRSFNSFNDNNITIAKNSLHFEELFKLYNGYDEWPEARHLLSIALGSTNRLEQINQVISFAFKSNVNDNDSRMMLIELAKQSRIGRQQVLREIISQQNFFNFISMKFHTLSQLYEFFQELIETYTIRTELQSLEQLIIANHTKIFDPIKQMLNFSLEKVQIMEQWYRNDIDSIQKFLFHEMVSMKSMKNEQNNNEQNQTILMDVQPSYLDSTLLLDSDHDIGFEEKDDDDDFFNNFDDENQPSSSSFLTTTNNSSNRIHKLFDDKFEGFDD
uniref:Puromycin-sensitive aminopeptidase-like n=1 Tax=Dermatophagoides pteronyssinus TaxID=6956 RepID=A0A6P6XYZ8_DERPT|nr:puromycin-sensitive aminopeptidase-like [Dermatophagoides pteronyssinus]